MKGFKLTKLKKINLSKGNVLKFIDKNNKNFIKFGEVYFYFVNYKSIKAWKMHKKMTLNITVPIGNVRFVLFEMKKNKVTKIEEVKIGQNDYRLLTINPKIWYGFIGISKNPSMIVSLTNMLHDENEMVRENINFFDYNWRKK